MSVNFCVFCRSSFWKVGTFLQLAPTKSAKNFLGIECLAVLVEQIFRIDKAKFWSNIGYCEEFRRRIYKYLPIKTLCVWVSYGSFRLSSPFGTHFRASFSLDTDQVICCRGKTTVQVSLRQVIQLCRSVCFATQGMSAWSSVLSWLISDIGSLPPHKYHDIEIQKCS